MKWVENKWFWLIGCFVLYANTLNHSYAVDDLIVVQKNSLTQKGIEAIPELFSHSYLFGYDGREDESYRPITLTTFAIERSLFNASSRGSHFIQVALYALFVWVTFCYLRLLFGENRLKIAAIICVLFALHPIHTEVVANIKSRDELLSALFLFSALLFAFKRNSCIRDSTFSCNALFCIQWRSDARPKKECCFFVSICIVFWIEIYCSF